MNTLCLIGWWLRSRYATHVCHLTHQLYRRGLHEPCESVSNEHRSTAHLNLEVLYVVLEQPLNSMRPYTRVPASATRRFAPMPISDAPSDHHNFEYAPVTRLVKKLGESSGPTSRTVGIAPAFPSSECRALGIGDAHGNNRAPTRPLVPRMIIVPQCSCACLLCKGMATCTDSIFNFEFQRDARG